MATNVTRDSASGEAPPATFGTSLRRSAPAGIGLGMIPAVLTAIGINLFANFGVDLLATAIVSGIAALLLCNRLAYQKRNMTTGVLASVWGGVLYLLMVVLLWTFLFHHMVWAYFVSYSQLLLFPVITITTVLIFGAWGAARGARRARQDGAVTQDMHSSTNPLAITNQLGALRQTYPPEAGGVSLLAGLGLIAFAIVLFIVERFVLRLQGTDVFHELIVGIAGVIVLIRRGGKAPQGAIAVFEHGVIAPSIAKNMVALRWTEIDPRLVQVTAKELIVVARSGLTVRVPKASKAYDELKGIIFGGQGNLVIAQSSQSSQR